MRCGELCARPLVRCRPRDSVARAARLMARQNVGFLPVCDERGVLIGVVTDRDLVVRAIARGLRPASLTVEAVMTPDPITCRTSDDVGAVEALLAQHRIERVPIVTRGGRCCGVITLADVARFESETGGGRVLRQIVEREVR